MPVPLSDLSIRPMTPEDAHHVGAWRYGEEWSVYDLPSPQPVLDALEDYYAVVTRGHLIGFCCVGEAARVAGLPLDADTLDVGLGMDPTLVGGGHGTAFGHAVLRYLAARDPGRSLRAVVQSWNLRSLRLTRRLGFNDVGELVAVQGGRAVQYRIVVRLAEMPTPE